MQHLLSFILIFLLGQGGILSAQSAEPTLLLRHPSVSGQHIAFTYANDIWIADKDGSEPRRLTIHDGAEGYPVLSPDGKWVAFSGDYDGNYDVFVVSTQGGMPKRLTYHPEYDFVRGWHGDKVLFSSFRGAYSSRFTRMYEIGMEQGG